MGEDYSIWDKLAYRGIIARAKKNGLLWKGSDGSELAEPILLKERNTLDQIISGEKGRIVEKQNVGPWLALIPGLILPPWALIIAGGIKTVGYTFTPYSPAHNETWYEWNHKYETEVYYTTDPDTGMLTPHYSDTVPGGKDPQPIPDKWHDEPFEKYFEEVEEHYDPIKKYVLEHPSILALAIAIPTAIGLGLYARKRWYDFLEDFLTSKLERMAEKRFETKTALQK